MACETRERTGRCSHTQCPYPSYTSHHYECIEVFTDGCEASENRCPDECFYKADEHRAEWVDENDPRRVVDPVRCRYMYCQHPVALEDEQVTCATCRKDLGLPPL